MFGHSLQFSILKNESLVCSTQLRIAHTTASHAHRDQALKKAAHTYAALQTHLNTATLSYEERSSLNRWIAEAGQELQDSCVTCAEPRATLPDREDQQMFNDFLKRLRNRSWREALSLIDLEYKRFAGNGHQWYSEQIINLCSYLHYPTKQIPKKYFPVLLTMIDLPRLLREKLIETVRRQRIY